MSGLPEPSADLFDIPGGDITKVEISTEELMRWHIVNVLLPQEALFQNQQNRGVNPKPSPDLTEEDKQKRGMTAARYYLQQILDKVDNKHSGVDIASMRQEIRNSGQLHQFKLDDQWKTEQQFIQEMAINLQGTNSVGTGTQEEWENLKLAAEEMQTQGTNKPRSYWGPAGNLIH